MEEGFFLFSYCILNHTTREEYSLHERLKLDKTVKNQRTNRNVLHQKQGNIFTKQKIIKKNDSTS